MHIPEQVMTYLSIEYDTISCRFRVPQERADKYLLVLSNLLSKKKVSFAELESMVGKLASLEVAVTAGMWYDRNQYSALYLIPISNQLKKEWFMWSYFLNTNKPGEVSQASTFRQTSPQMPQRYLLQERLTSHKEQL